MYGVILWSDPNMGKAVIWCEDHGDLAYYEAPERGAHLGQFFFDTGDFVEFDVTDEARMRRARNAQKVTTRAGGRVRPLGPALRETAGDTSREALVDNVILLADRLRTREAKKSDVNRRG
jgi:hypothetical protein